MTPAPHNPPDWDQLFETAAAQEGLFTTQQAAAAGYSPQLIAHHLRTGRMLRVRRGVNCIVHLPVGDHEDLAAVWLWSQQEGVFSHQTALALHNLSDVLPAQLHLTLPLAWRSRRLRIPEGVVLHFGDLAEQERVWVGPVPVTAPLRTLGDCAAAHLQPDLLRDAARSALARGMVSRGDLAAVEAALAAFGGLEP
jgi:predicted transcriptional regulator of viral defense system